MIFLIVTEPVWALDQSFNMGLSLFQPVSVIKNKDITFPTKILSGTDEIIVVTTNDTGAAVFDAYGGKDRTLVRTVLERNIALSASGVATTIVIDGFSIAGPTAFDSTGKALGLKIGATAKILSDSKDGDYVGVGTFRVVYQ